jgi:phosphoglycolate phosphatase
MSAKWPVKAVLFDLDGTLVDTVADLAEAVNRTLAELRLPACSLSEVRAMIGNGPEELVRRSVSRSAPASGELVAKALEIFKGHYREINGNGSGIYPGVVRGLEQLHNKGVAMGVVTNKHEEFTYPLLEMMGIRDFFHAVVCGDSLQQRKPDPGPLLHACKLLGVSPGETLMIGDSENDSIAGRRAGMRVLLVTYGYSEQAPVDTLDRDGLLSSATEVVDYIAD